MNPDLVNILPSWRNALKQEFESPYFNQLAESLKNCIRSGTIVYPPGQLIFNAYNQVEPHDIRVVILGQDPYHNPGEAMGLSFSVPKGIKIPPSLKNIYKELSDDLGCITPNHGDLTHWANQGVFLLNAFLTVEKNNAASHRNFGWDRFTDATIRYISGNFQHIVFMLWGNFAKKKKILIDGSRHLILEAAHPSPLARNAFSGCNHFSKANNYLIKNGGQAIEWQIH